jgi:hypothetical protein
VKELLQIVARDADRRTVLRRRRTLTDGSAHAYARTTFYSGLAAWAWAELADGANWLRRAFGAAGLGYVIVKVGHALGA